VFGSLGATDPGFTEESQIQPNSPYSASKASSDLMVRAYGETYGLPVVMSNCSNNFGPHQDSEKLIPVIIQQCLKKEPIPIYGDGSNIRDWLYVKDHCDAIMSVLQYGLSGERYNIGGDNELTNLALTTKICQVMNQRVPIDQPYESLITFVSDRLGHDYRYAINSSKLKQLNNWKSQTSFEEALSETINYYLNKIK
jgi:dTDP-glucose 4,6-dehydratase